MSLGRTHSDYTPRYEFLTRVPTFGRTRKPFSLLALRSSKNPNVARPTRRTSLPPCHAPSSSSSSPSSTPSCLGWMFEEHKRKWPVLRTQRKTSNKRLKTLKSRRSYNS
ncbi:unnamed protein product [Malus baccata var. baccata]